jgi:hypothetical protein
MTSEAQGAWSDFEFPHIADDPSSTSTGDDDLLAGAAAADDMDDGDQDSVTDGSSDGEGDGSQHAPAEELLCPRCNIRSLTFRPEEVACAHVGPCCMECYVATVGPARDSSHWYARCLTCSSFTCRRCAAEPPADGGGRRHHHSAPDRLRCPKCCEDSVVDVIAPAAQCSRHWPVAKGARTRCANPAAVFLPYLCCPHVPTSCADHMALASFATTKYVCSGEHGRHTMVMCKRCSKASGFWCLDCQARGVQQPLVTLRTFQLARAMRSAEVMKRHCPSSPSFVVTRNKPDPTGLDTIHL